MKNITQLFVFDFDETLFRMPGYTDRFSVERINPDLTFPTPYSFYDSPTSMDPKIHNIQLIDPVYKDWLAASQDSTARTILVTHRTEKLRKYAEILLDQHKIKFDESYFLGRLSEKILILEKELSYLPDIKNIIIYEDSLEQLIKYQKFYYEYTNIIHRSLSTLDNLITIEMKFVDKSSVISLYDFKVSDSKRIELI